MYKSNCVHSPDRCTPDDRFEEMVISEAERVKPIIEEQFLKEYILGIGDTYEIFNIYCKTFNIESSLETRVIILKSSDIHDDEDYFFIKNIAEQYIGKENILLSTKMYNHLCIITRILDKSDILEAIDKI